MKFLFLLIFIIYSYKSYSSQIGSETGFNIPRYVSIKSNEVNVRIGPSENYPISIKYIKKNFPVEIIDEHKNWRKIMDYYENTGWIKKNLLQGERFAIVKKGTDNKFVYINPIGFKIGEIEQINIVKIKKCRKEWCYISFENYHGWMKKNNLWGVYEDELYNTNSFQIIENLYWKISLFFFKLNKNLINTIQNLKS